MKTKSIGSHEYWTASRPRISATNPVSNLVRKNYYETISIYLMDYFQSEDVIYVAAIIDWWCITISLFVVLGT